MDVLLGVAVTGPTAHLALIDASACEGHPTIDHSTIDLTDQPTETLAKAIAATSRLLHQDEHRLAATTVCWSDEQRLDELRDTLVKTGVHDITTVSPPQAAAALVRNIAHTAPTDSVHTDKNMGATRGQVPRESALLFLDDDTATLSIIGADHVATTVAAEPVAGSDPVTACRTVLGHLSQTPSAADGLYMISTATDLAPIAERIRDASPAPHVFLPDEPDLELARGAALSGSSGTQPGIATQANTRVLEPETVDGDGTPTPPGARIGPHLAYSLASDSGSLPPLSAAEYDIPMQTAMSPLSQLLDTQEEEESTADASRRHPRLLLLGSSIAAAVIVGFAALAVTVAIGIRPTANQQTVEQQAAHPVPTFLPLQPANEATPAPQVLAQVPATQPLPEAATGGAPAGTDGSGPALAEQVRVPELPEQLPVPAGEAPAAEPVPADVPQPPPINLPNIQLPPIIVNLQPGGAPGATATGPGTQPGAASGGGCGTAPGNGAGALPTRGPQPTPGPGTAGCGRHPGPVSGAGGCGTSPGSGPSPAGCGTQSTLGGGTGDGQAPSAGTDPNTGKQLTGGAEGGVRQPVNVPQPPVPVVDPPKPQVVDPPKPKVVEQPQPQPPVVVPKPQPPLVPKPAPPAVQPPAPVNQPQPKPATPPQLSAAPKSGHK